MKIVCDTNVLIAASLWRGSSSKILEAIERKQWILVTSEDILQEYYRVLESEEISKKVTEKFLVIKLSTAKIRSLATIVSPQIKYYASKDPDDNKIIECAVEAKADYIISYDHDLLDLQKIEGIPIITPEQFLKVTKK